MLPVAALQCMQCLKRSTCGGEDSAVEGVYEDLLHAGFPTHHQGMLPAAALQCSHCHRTVNM